MPWRKYTEEDGDSYNYNLRKQRERYANDDNYKANSHLKYYKRKFKDNKDFLIILNQKDKTKRELLFEVLIWNTQQKVNKKMDKIMELKYEPETKKK